jgi:phosphatidylinositol phospholipase C, delta
MHLSPTSASNWVRKERRRIARLSAEIVKPKSRSQSPAAAGNVPSAQAIDASQPEEDSAEDAFTIPEILLVGTEMTKVSTTKEKRRTFRLDPDEGKILFNKDGDTGASRFRDHLFHRSSSPSNWHAVSIETIKEIRSGAEASYYRSMFKYPEDAEKRWITVVYILDSKYKTLHMIADTEEIMALWDKSLRKLFSIRQGLMNGVVDIGTKETMWERQYWKSADKGSDQKLSFEEVQWLLWRLNANVESQNAKALFEVSLGIVSAD